VDGTVLPRVQELYGRMRCVFFAPEDLEIVSGAPGERRRFLDMAISQLEPSHIETLQGYQRTIQQRNSVLRRIRDRRGDPNESPELDVWEEQCAVLGAAVLERRWRMLREFGPLLSRCYESLAGHGLDVEYQGDVWGGDADECRKELAERYFARRESDMESAGTTTGPHRDDLRFRVRDVVLRQFGSQGERRSAALALRLAQADHMLEKTGKDPILLVDDVIYEMDPARQGAFLAALRRRGQVFFTVTDLANLGGLAEHAKVFRVEGGKVEQKGTDAGEEERGTDGPQSPP
jgi:DNA replication and repair protein RecF